MAIMVVIMVPNDDQVLNSWKTKKEKNKMQGLKAKVYARAYCFAGEDAIKCVIGFRKDSQTMKRETPKFNAVI